MCCYLIVGHIRNALLNMLCAWHSPLLHTVDTALQQEKMDYYSSTYCFGQIAHLINPLVRSYI